MTKGYKATHNYQCRDQIYEIGKEYKLEYEAVVCDRGFHYCENAKDVLSYYYYLSCFKLLEIEDLNPEESDHRCDKSSSNHIKIIREISNKNELMNLLELSEIPHPENENIEEYHYHLYDTNKIYKIIFDFKNKIDTIEEVTPYRQDFVEYTYHKNGQFKTFKNYNGSHYIYTSKGWEQC